MASLWMIGNNAYNEGGIESDDINNTDKYIYSAKNLRLLQWAKTKNIIEITIGSGFNIYTIASIKNELLSVGFVRDIEKTLKQFILIPNCIILECVKYFGNHFKEYWLSGYHFIEHKEKYLIFQPLDLIISPSKIIETDIYKMLYCGVHGLSVLWITNDDKLHVMGGNHCGQLPICTKYTDKVKYAASTAQCNIILDNDGNLWWSGSSTIGENGCGANDNYAQTQVFTHIVSMQNIKVSAVSMGDLFTIFTTQNGDVFGCGHNQYGQLGLGFTDDGGHILPRKIEYFCENNIKIINVLCGSSHCIALSHNINNNKIYTWGENMDGQCGIGKPEEPSITMSPTPINQLIDKKIKSIKCGGAHTGCITDGNEIYLWGENTYNQCCYVKDEIDKVYTPYCINQYVLAQSNKKYIIDVILGCSTTFILLS